MPTLAAPARKKRKNPTLDWLPKFRERGLVATTAVIEVERKSAWGAWAQGDAILCSFNLQHTVRVTTSRIAARMQLLLTDRALPGCLTVMLLCMRSHCRTLRETTATEWIVHSPLHELEFLMEYG